MSDADEYFMRYLRTLDCMMDDLIELWIPDTFYCLDACCNLPE